MTSWRSNRLRLLPSPRKIINLSRRQSATTTYNAQRLVHHKPFPHRLTPFYSIFKSLFSSVAEQPPSASLILLHSDNHFASLSLSLHLSSLFRVSAYASPYTKFAFVLIEIPPVKSKIFTLLSLSLQSQRRHSKDYALSARPQRSAVTSFAQLALTLLSLCCRTWASLCSRMPHYIYRKINRISTTKKSPERTSIPATQTLELLCFHPDSVGAASRHKSPSNQQLFNFQFTIKFAS